MCQGFVQCLNLGDNHWITISTLGCTPGTVIVYDSLNLRLSKSLKNIVADLIHTSNSTIVIKYANMQYQRGGSDCGLFAIATACVVCNGDDPTSLHFEQPLMREHLLKALESKKLSPFPSQHRRVAISQTREEILEVFYVCRMPNDGKTILQCSACQEWYHCNCVRVQKRFLNPKVPWICGTCK